MSRNTGFIHLTIHMYTVVNVVDDEKYKVSEGAIKTSKFLECQIEDGGCDEDLFMTHRHTDLVPLAFEFMEYYAKHPYEKTDDKGEVTWNIKLRSTDFSENVDYENKDRSAAKWYNNFLTKFGPQFDEKPDMKDEGDKRWFEVNNELFPRTRELFKMMEIANYLQCDSLFQLVYCKLGETSWKGRESGILPIVAANLPIELLKKENSRKERQVEAHGLTTTKEWEGKPFIDVLEHVYKLHMPTSVGGFMEEEGEAGGEAAGGAGGEAAGGAGGDASME